MYFRKFFMKCCSKFSKSVPPPKNILRTPMNRGTGRGIGNERLFNLTIKGNLNSDACMRIIQEHFHLDPAELAPNIRSLKIQILVWTMPYRKIQRDYPITTTPLLNSKYVGVVYATASPHSRHLDQ